LQANSLGGASSLDSSSRRGEEDKASGDKDVSRDNVEGVKDNSSD